MKSIKDMTLPEYCAMKKHPNFYDIYPFATGDYIKDKVRSSKGFVNFNPRIKKGDYVVKIGNWWTRTFIPIELLKVTYVCDYSPVMKVRSVNTEIESPVVMNRVRLATAKEISKHVK